MLGERLQPLLPRLAGLQRAGRRLDSEGADRGTRHAETLPEPDCTLMLLPPPNHSSATTPVLAPVELRRYTLSVVDADPDGPEPLDDQRQQDRRYLELKQRRDGMWQLQGELEQHRGCPTERPRWTR